MTPRFARQGLLLALASCASCTRDVARVQESTLATAHPSDERVAPSPERPMATRSEAQPYLDSAAVLLARGDTKAAVALLHRAAARVEASAGEPRGASSDALAAIGDSIDRMAGAMARRERLGASALPRMSALLNLAEADRHLALASVACSTRSRESIYDELTMAADHTERALRDEGHTVSASTRRAIAEVRQGAAPLAANCVRELGPLDDAITTLRLEIARVRRTLQTQ